MERVILHEHFKQNKEDSLLRCSLKISKKCVCAFLFKNVKLAVTQGRGIVLIKNISASTCFYDGLKQDKYGILFLKVFTLFRISFSMIGQVDFEKIKIHQM